MSSVVAFATCAWAADNYFDTDGQGKTFTRTSALLGAVPACCLLIAFLLEFLLHKCSNKIRPGEDDGGNTEARTTVFRHMVNTLANNRLILLWTIHLGTSLATIFSVCVAAVNIYTSTTDGLYALSCITIGFYTIYMAFYTPDNAMSLALYKILPEAEQRLASLQRAATSYVLRPSALNPSDYT